MKFHPIFKGSQEELVMFDNGFQVPSFTKQTDYQSTSHASYQRRQRQRFMPYDFPVPLRIYNEENALRMEEVIRRVNAFFYTDKPEIFKIPETNYYFIGEFDGPVELDFNMNVINYIDLNFHSAYPYKFYDDEKIQTAAKTVTISTKSQLPTIPLIELTGLTGTDVQISISGDSFMRIRLTGNIPARLTIDIENESIYETNSGLNMVHLFRRDSAFEDFRIKNGDVVVLTNASSTAQAKLTYKELLL